MAHSRHAHNRPAPESIPEVDFTDAASNVPVDSTRGREIEIPEELLDAFLASLPRYEGPVDLGDTAPPARRTHARHLPWSDLEEPLFEATPVTGIEPPRRSTRAARPYVTIDVPPEEDPATTAAMRARRRLSLLDHLALTGKIPRQIKLAFAAVLTVLLLLLAWIQVEQRIASQVLLDRASALQVATVPLLDAPVVKDLGAEPQAVAQPVKAMNAPSTDNAIVHATGKSKNQTAPSPKESKKPDFPAAAAKKAPPAAASTNRSGLTPIFEPR
jgi:hypothetical protein